MTARRYLSIALVFAVLWLLAAACAVLGAIFTRRLPRG